MLDPKPRVATAEKDLQVGETLRALRPSRGDAS
jgi:hypothetical protein